jgi:hypothetical protein
VNDGGRADHYHSTDQSSCRRALSSGWGRPRLSGAVQCAAATHEVRIRPTTGQHRPGAVSQERLREQSATG